MNYLAHLALADGSDDSIVGNFLGDFVKGRPEGRFAPAVVRGIRLHRRLDTYTDTHPVVIRAVGRLPREHRRVAWIAVDMAFDHFLARDWSRYQSRDFAAFREHAYAVLGARMDIMPPRARRITPRLIDGDWLGSYAEIEGVADALQNMSRRLSRPNALAETADDIRCAYDGLESDFHAFWPDAKDFAAAEARRLRSAS